MWSEMLKPECVYQFVDIETGEICCNHFEVMGWKCRPDGCKYILDETNDWRQIPMGSQAQGYESPFLCNGALPKLKFGVDGGGIDTNLNFSQKGSQ